MAHCIALVALAALAIGCGRPEALQREQRLDSECRTGTAYLYPIGLSDQRLITRAVRAGCHAPIGAWTVDSDLEKGGTRKLVFDLRAQNKTFLCCP